MIILNNLIPFRGFKAINLIGIVFVRKEYENQITLRDINHEDIHTAQMRELLFIFFYVIYFFEWLIRLMGPSGTAYRNISFEREAYNHEDDLRYLDKRKHFAQWRK